MIDSARFLRLRDELRDGFPVSGVSWIPITAPRTFESYNAWLEKGFHGEMKYLEAHRPAKADPRHLLPEARSLLLLTCSYLPHPAPTNVLPGTRIASYARGEDYHVWLKRLLEQVRALIEKEFPGSTVIAGTDILPVLERDFAAQAGLGWIGKNTCLIHPQKGSFHFIAELLTDIAVPGGEIEPIPDFCGTCTKCIDICPTGALESPRQLNATKCISYWTIEAKTVPPEEMRPRFHDLFFGCDLCQSVCPWNKKAFRGKDSALLDDPAGMRQLNAEQRADLIASLRFLLTASNRRILERMHGTPLERARPFGLRRNALIVAANSGLRELSAEVTALHDDTRLGELAKWCTENLKFTLSKSDGPTS